MTPSWLPSWLLWPPNCCETCESWQRQAKVTTIDGDVVSDFIGVCNSPISLDSGTITDSRYRCPTFKRQIKATPAQSDAAEGTAEPG